MRQGRKARVRWAYRGGRGLRPRGCFQQGDPSSSHLGPTPAYTGSSEAGSGGTYSHRAAAGGRARAVQMCDTPDAQDISGGGGCGGGQGPLPQE